MDSAIAHHICAQCGKKDRCSVFAGDDFYAAKDRMRAKMAADCGEDQCYSRQHVILSNGRDRARA